MKFEELQRKIMLGVETSERRELIDGETVFHQLDREWVSQLPKTNVSLCDEAFSRESIYEE